MLFAELILTVGLFHIPGCGCAGEAATKKVPFHICHFFLLPRGNSFVCGAQISCYAHRKRLKSKSCTPNTVKVSQTYFLSSLPALFHYFSLSSSHLTHSLLLLLLLLPSLCLIVRGFVANCPIFPILAQFNSTFLQRIIQV